MVGRYLYIEDSNCSFHFIDDLANAGTTEKETVVLTAMHVHSDNWGSLIIWWRASGAGPKMEACMCCCIPH